MDKIIIAIGGGEIKNKTTLEIDRYIASLAKEHAGDKRANALFIGTASHDSMPYFNSFRKTYTSVFDIKAEVALMVYGEMSVEKIATKIEMADCIYIGGGDTVFMMEQWKKTGLLPLILQAYERGVPIAGLSAGAICWFDEIYTDSLKTEDGAKYAMFHGLGLVRGVACPHYDERREEFDEIVKERYSEAIAMEADGAVVLEDGVIVGSVTSGGKAYRLTVKEGVLSKSQI